MKFSTYIVAAMLTWLLPSSLYAQNVRGTVTGNAIQLTITGGYLPVTYLWSNGSTDGGLSNLANGRYCVTVTDALCGVASQCFEVNQPCVLTGFIFTVKRAPCAGLSDGSLCVSAVSGPKTAKYSYIWSNGATTSCNSGIASGTYSVTITDDKGCKGSESFYLAPSTLIKTSEQITEACKTDDGLGAISVRVASPKETAFLRYKYAWNNGATTAAVTGLQPATYTVTITDFQGCLTTRSVIVPKADMAGDVIVAKVTNVSDCTGLGRCSGPTGRADGAIELEVVRPRNYSFTWSGTSTGLPNAPKVDQLCPGRYGVDITIANVPACRLSLAESVCCCFYELKNGYTPPPACSNNNPTPLNVTLNPKSPSTSGSADGQITLTTSGGTGQKKIKWTLPDNSILRGPEILTGLSKAGKYCVNVTDGCSDITKCVELEFCSNITIAIAEQITKTCDCTVSPDCNAGKIQLTSVTGGITPHKFSWSNGKTTKDIENLAKGNYTVTATTASGCSQTKAFTVGAVATTFALNTRDCRYYDEVCPINNKVVKTLSKAAPVSQRNVYFPADCTIQDICLNGQKVLVETLVPADGETKVINGQCVKLDYCKRLSTLNQPAQFFPRSSTNVAPREVYVGRDDNACPGVAHFRINRYCGGTYFGYRCEAGPSPNGEGVTVNNDKIKNKMRLFELLDSFDTENGSLYLVPQSVNSKTTVAEFEKLMSETTAFSEEDLKDYRTLKESKIKQLNPVTAFKVFPNPFNQSFTIEIDNQDISKATVSIYNALGQVVISNQYNFTKGKNVVNIDAKQLNESIYVVEMIDEKGVRTTQKMVKRN